MYKLTLTKNERAAFDWVGNRYNSGDIMNILLTCEREGDNRDWDDNDGDLTFIVPEYKAWEIKDLAEQEDYAFPCFANELKGKMWDFCDNIV